MMWFVLFNFCCCSLILGAIADDDIHSSSNNYDSDATLQNKKTKRPHVLMIVMDDLGSHDLGIHGSGIHTPHIDALINNKDNLGVGGAIYLDQYYVLPYCSPTRAALLSGRYPLHTGVHNVIREASTAGLPLEEETLADIFLRAGYDTHAVGKWHVGHSRWEQTPTFRGFNSFFGFYMGGQDYYKHSTEGGYDFRNDGQLRCGSGCSQVADERGNYSTHVFTREAIRVIHEYADVARDDNEENDQDDKPLFLYLAYQAVHCPNEVPEMYQQPYENHENWSSQRKNYAGMLTAADEGIGNVTMSLKQAGLWNDTLIIFTTDNGGPTTLGCTQGSSNYPKRGGKCSLWEGGTTGDGFIGGPALKSYFGFADVPRRFPHLFHVVDWLPTLSELIGVVPRNLAKLDGKSQVRAMKTNIATRFELFGGYCQCLTATDKTKWWGPSLRHLNWKIVQGTSAGPDENDANPPGFHEIRLPGNSSNYLLFDLQADPLELVDLADQYPNVLQDMILKLSLYAKSFVPPQSNDDSQCHFPGLVNTSVGPTWLPWCDTLQQEIGFI